ncbi:MAG: hemerythrin domain-containing protein [Nitrososphaeria archaeon]
MKIEHEDLRARKKALKNLLDKRDRIDQRQWANDIYEICNHIILTLRDHIFKENNILYPLALKMVPESEWDKISEEFDSIGYCCFTPKVKVRGGHQI